MKKNMGTIDRVIRVLIALIVMVMYFSQLITGTIAIITLVFAVVFLITSLISFCPLYVPFKISTCKVKKE